MPPDETLRRRSDQEELARYELMDQITKAVNAGVDRAIIALEAHKIDVHAHQDTAQATLIKTLWDERNTLKGWIAAFALAGAILGGLIGAALPLVFR